MLNLEGFGAALPQMNNLFFKNSPEQVENYEFKKDYHRKPLVMIFAEIEEIRTLFKTVIEMWNYEVVEAESVEQLINIAEAQHPDLVRMDTRLFILDSLILMKRIREHRYLEDTPFVLLSGHAQDAVRRTALDAGAQGFMVKPVNFEALQGILRAYLKDDIRPVNDGNA